VILVGAGFAAQMVIRELARPSSGYLAVGCVDDDRTKMGVHIQGVPVLGTVEEIAGMVAYLAGPEAAYVTGASLLIDGGFSA